MSIRKIDKNIGTIPNWGDDDFDENVHKNFTDLKTIIPAINNTIDDINGLLATIQAVNALGGVGLVNLSNEDILEWDSALSKFKNTNLHSKTAKTTIEDKDEIAVASSSDNFSLKKISWANIKTLLSTLFITKVTTPIAGALAKINSQGNLVSSNVIIKDNGNILIGTNVDNGVDAFQINGTIASKNKIVKTLDINQTFLADTWTDIFNITSADFLDNTFESLYLINIYENSGYTSGLNYTKIYTFVSSPFYQFNGNDTDSLPLQLLSSTAHATVSSIQLRWQLQPNHNYAKLQLNHSNGGIFNQTAGKELKLKLRKI